MNPTFFFSKNWNGKLTADFFTTIRFDSWIRIGIDVDIVLNRKYLFTAEVLDKEIMPFGQIPKKLVIIDTGYSYEESIEIFMKFGKIPNVSDLMTKNADVFLLRRIKTKRSK